MASNAANLGLSTLIVDDSRTTRMVLRRIMESLGCEVEEAEHGAQALERLSAHGSYDLALIDWNMPVMNGLDLLNKLSTLLQYAQMRILMISTRGELDDMLEAITVGATDYLTKPFSKMELIEKLDSLGFSV